MALADPVARRGASAIAGYGASGRANTIIQYCGIDHAHLEYMIDDAPAKEGYYTPGSHLRDRPSNAILRTDPPDYLLVFAWASSTRSPQVHATISSAAGG